MLTSGGSLFVKSFEHVETNYYDLDDVMRSLFTV